MYSVPVVEHSKVGVVEREVIALLNGDCLKVHLLGRLKVAPLAEDVAQVEAELCSCGEYPEIKEV